MEGELSGEDFSGSVWPGHFSGHRGGCEGCPDLEECRREAEDIDAEYVLTLGERSEEGEEEVDG